MSRMLTRSSLQLYFKPPGPEMLFSPPQLYPAWGGEERQLGAPPAWATEETELQRHLGFKKVKLCSGPGDRRFRVGGVFGWNPSHLLRVRRVEPGQVSRGPAACPHEAQDPRPPQTPGSAHSSVQWTRQRSLHGARVHWNPCRQGGGEEGFKNSTTSSFGTGQHTCVHPA